MKKSESILLIATIGLGVVLAATRLPGKGRVESGQDVGAHRPAAPGQRATLRRALTLELLVAKRATLKPLPPTLRNPFRPIGEDAEADELRIAISVTGIFGDAQGGDGRLSAIVRGTLIKGQDEAGATVLRVKRAGTGLAELLRGKRVRQGDAIGALEVVYVGERGVVLLYQGQRIPVKLYTQAADGAGNEQDTSGTSPTGDEHSPRSTHLPGIDTENPLRTE